MSTTVIYRLNQSLWFCVQRWFSWFSWINHKFSWVNAASLGLSRIHISPSIFRNTLIAVRNFTRRIEIKFFAILWFCIVKNVIVFFIERNESLIYYNIISRLLNLHFRILHFILATLLHVFIYLYIYKHFNIRNVYISIYNYSIKMFLLIVIFLRYDTIGELK